MIELSVKQKIRARPDVVFARVAEPDHRIPHLQGLTRWEWLDGASPGHGARCLVLLRVGSIDAGGVVRITEWEPPRAIAWIGERGVRQSGRVTLRPFGDETEISIELEFEVPGAWPIARIVERMARRLVARRLEALLLGLRRQIEFEDGAVPIEVPQVTLPAGASGEAFTPVDAAWLRMGDKSHAMTITSLLMLEEPLTYAELAALLEERLLRVPRFHERVRDFRLPGRLPRWEPDPDFDLRHHIQLATLPAPGDQRALEDLVSGLLSTPLDHARPLWQVHLVERFGTGSVLVARLHHCIGDGVALIGVMLSLTDEGAGLTPETVGVSEAVPHGIERFRHAGEQAAALAHNLMLSNDPETPFQGRPGTLKRVAWSQPIALSEIKSVSRALGATVNDVLVAAVTGALRTRLDASNVLSEGMEIRALVPVYVRAKGPAKLGNHFGLVFADLPLWINDPLERVREIKRRFDGIKQSPDPGAALWLLGAMGMASGELERIAVDLFTRKATVMMTNVPGPPARVHLAGKALGGMMLWAPVSGHLGVSLSLLSYAGEVKLGIALDAAIAADPRAIAGDFEAEVKRLLALCTARAPAQRFAQ